MKAPQICDEEIILDDFIKVKKIHLQYSEKQKFSRYVVIPKRSVAILLHIVDVDRVVLVKQFRLASSLENNKDGFLYEIPAGLADKQNESLEAAAKRECEEETGYRPNSIKHIFDYFVSPGYSSEKLTFFYARTDSNSKVFKGGGLASEQEIIESKEFSLNVASKMIEEGEIQDAKSIIALQWLKLND